MRFILAAEEPSSGAGSGSTLLEALTVKFYRNSCSGPEFLPFLSFTLPTNNCSLTTGYYVFSLSSDQAAILQPYLDTANCVSDPTCPNGPSFIYVGGSITVSRDDTYATPTTAGEILYVAKAVSPACTAITVNPASIANGTINAVYNPGFAQTFTATGGTQPYTFSATSGLPLGLSLTDSGILNGTPVVAGAFNFIVTATDDNGCTGSRAYTLNVQCTAASSPAIPTGRFESSGGSGAFEVVSDGRLWNVTVDQSWVTIDSGQFGSGDGTVRYSVSANASGATRSATITVNQGVRSQTQQITQTCNAISPTHQEFGPSSGIGTINVSPQGAGCGWSASESLSWLNITSGGSGTSAGTITYAVDPNTPSGRSGSVDISGFPYVVKQAGSGGDALTCTTKSITVGSSISGTLTQSDCPSSFCSNIVADNYSFSGTAGQRVSVALTNASATVLFLLKSPSGKIITSTSTPVALPYAGTYTIEVYTFNAIQPQPVTYTVSLCDFTVTPAILYFGYNGGTQTVSVTEHGSCSWTVNSSLSNWVQVSQGQNSVSITVAATDSTFKATGAARSGVLTIAGKEVLILQGRQLVMVTNLNDSGAGSLRQAITDGNALDGTTYIFFNIPGSAPYTINLLSPLPALSMTMVIDATTQPGYAGQPIVELNGASAGGTAKGLVINSSVCRVKGLIINRFGSNGIEINGVNTNNNSILNCYVGTNAAGTAGQGNGGNGIAIISGFSNSIGSSSAADRNVISGNAGSGVQIFNSTDNQVRSNYIGTDATGTVALGNHDGIQITSSGSSNLIGGTASGNLISGNQAIGVVVNSGTRNTIRGNSIYANAGLGIDLGGDGVTGNDTGDGDSGANNKQNFPLLTSAVRSGANITIAGSLNSTANATFTIDFYANASCDSSGNGEGQTYLGSTTVTTNGSGNATINKTLTAGSVGQSIAATAMNTSGDSSEFSPCFVMPVAASLQFSAATYSVNENGGSATITVSRTGSSSGAVSVSYATSNGTATAGQDYTAASGTLNWVSGDTSNKSFFVTLLDDAAFEGNETINLTLSNQTGNATLGSPATAVLTIMDNEVCSYSLSATSQSFAAPGGNGSVNVLVMSPCPWTAASNAGWITITAGASGSGNGTVSYSVAANVNVNSRSATMTIAGQTFTVTQTGIPAVGLSYYRASLDADAKTDLGYYRAGLWGFLMSSLNYSTSFPQFFSWGGIGLQPVSGDFDGDGRADIGYIVPPGSGQSAAYAILLSSRSYSFASGQPLFVPAGFPSIGDTPVIGDVDGDGKADPGYWRATEAIWTVPKSSSNYTQYLFLRWGQFGDVPLLADFDQDGKADIGFYRDGLWGVLKSSASYSTDSPQYFSWGGAGLQPVVGDFDGDGRADIGYIVPPAGGQSAAYAILLSSRNYSFAAGQPLFVPAGFPSLGDTPVIGDFDGDGKYDPGIWRESQGVWIIPKSSSNYTQYLFSQWGGPGDIAFPNSAGRH